MSVSQEAAGSRTLVIEAGRTELHYWRDIWNYRELLYFLAWRDILVRYKQTVLGAAWALVRPFMTMVVFTIVFGKIAKLPSGDVPYPIMVFAALLPWQFFSSAINDAGNSLIANANLISKVYFPRILVPISSIGVCLIDFLVSCAIMVGLMIWYHYVPSWRLVCLPVFLLIAFAVSAGFGMWLAALNVKYRDFRYIVPFIVQFGLYLSPVGFSSAVVPMQWQTLYALNPMVGVIDGFRWCLLGGDQPFNQTSFTLSLVMAVLWLLLGIRYFRSTEKNFADVI